MNPFLKFQTEKCHPFFADHLKGKTKEEQIRIITIVANSRWTIDKALDQSLREHYTESSAVCNLIHHSRMLLSQMKAQEDGSTIAFFPKCFENEKPLRT